MSALSLIKLVGGPGSIGFLAVGSTLGLLLLRFGPRRRRFARAWLITLYAAYLVLGLPLVARTIAAPFADPLAGRQPVEPRIDTLIVFDGDNRIGRVEEAERLWAAAHPAVVIASGEPWLVDHLIERGIPRERIVHDRVSGTTREQVDYVKSYVKLHPEARVALIASRLQMPRVMALSYKVDTSVMFYASPVDREPVNQGLLLYVPTYTALRVSRDAMYERVACVYYRRQGWIDGDASPTPGLP